MIDLDKLEALAKAANEFNPYWSDAGSWAADLGNWTEGEYIAALDPKSVLALIAEVRALRETLSHPIAWRCDWDGRDGTGVWHQYHDAEDPLPEAWDDEVPVITPLYAARGAK